MIDGTRALKLHGVHARDKVGGIHSQLEQHQLKPHEWEAVLKRTLVRWNASGRRHQSEVVVDVSQVVRLGDTQETLADGGPLWLGTCEELCALETLLTREIDA